MEERQDERERNKRKKGVLVKRGEMEEKEGGRGKRRSYLAKGLKIVRRIKPRRNSFAS